MMPNIYGSEQEREERNELPELDNKDVLDHDELESAFTVTFFAWSTWLVGPV